MIFREGRVILYKSRLANDLVTFLFVLSLFLLPFDAVKLLPSNYRPLSLIPTVFLFLMVLPDFFKQKLDRATIALLIFYLCSNLASLTNIDYSDFSSSVSYYLDYLITSSIMLVTFLSFNTVFRSFPEDNKLQKWFPKVICYAYFIPICLAFIDGLSIYGLLPGSISTILHKVFGGSQTTRICGFTLEASWLTMHILFSIPAYLYCLFTKSVKKIFYVPVVLSAVVLVISFSFQAIVYLAIIAFILWILVIRKHATIARLYIPVFLVAAFAIFVAIVSRIDSDIYFIERFKHLSFSYLLYNDASFFIRFINPVVALILFLQHPILGIGGGFYPTHYGKIIETYFPMGLEIYNGNNEIVDTIDSVSANSKCLYTRLLGEFGLVSIIFFIFLVLVLRKGNKNSENKMLIIWAIVVCVLMLQFDSFCYFPFIVFLAFYNNLHKSKEESLDSKGKENS